MMGAAHNNCGVVQSCYPASLQLLSYHTTLRPPMVCRVRSKVATGDLFQLETMKVASGQRFILGLRYICLTCGI